MVDLDIGTTQRIRLGRHTAEVKLLSTSEDRDKVRSAIREARVEVDRRFNETIYALDERGRYHRYTHLHSFDPSVRLGDRVKVGQKIGTVGKEGSSGGWSHLQYAIIGKQRSG